MSKTLENTMSTIPATKLSVGTIFPILDEAWMCMLQPQAPVPCFVGAPGVGKTQLVYQWANLRGLEVIELNGSTMSPTDYVAYVPDMATRTLAEFVHSQLMRCCDPAFRGVLFIDELHQTHPEVQKPLSKTLNQRMVGSHRLSDGCVIVTAGNRVTDKAGANRLLSMIANRVDTIPVEVDNDALLHYFIEQDHPEPCIAFLAAVPYDEGKDFQPQDPAFFTPRSFERVAIKMKLAGRAPSLASVASSIGPGRAREFVSFLSLVDKLPTQAEVLRNPKGTRIPDRLDEMCAMVCMLVVNATKDVLDANATYLRRMKIPMQVLGLRMLMRNKALVSGGLPPALQQWLLDPAMQLAVTDRTS